MTALRAPTGGSSDGGDDDASAETVSDHGDSLREIALLIDALRDDDVAARQRSHAALPKIAAALGPRRCRDELVPFVCDLTDDVDGVLLELATRLAELGPLVGGARHAHVLLEPLAQLCAAEDAGVRAAAAETARGVCAALPEAAVAELEEWESEHDEEDSVSSKVEEEHCDLEKEAVTTTEKMLQRLKDARERCWRNYDDMGEASQDFTAFKELVMARNFW